MKDEITVADDLLFHTVEKLKQLDAANVTDERERTRRELTIYKGYFDVLAGIVKNLHSDGKTETAREYVGRHIHPGYLIMLSVIALYTNDAIIVPPSKRFDCVYPLSELMVLIGARWRDADNAAMNVLACLDDIWGKMAELDESPKIDEAIERWLAEPDHYEPMTAGAKSFLADFDRMKRALRQRLIELSAVLMGAPASGVDSETLAAVQDMAHNVRAARADIAAIGEDAHAGRVAAEKLADELEGWREWIALCVRKSGGKQTDQAQADAPQMFVAVRDAIYQLWKRFNAEPADCEMRDGSLRKPGQKRTYAECVEQHAATVVYTSPATGRKFYLREYCRSEQELEKTINAARMAEKRKHGAKNSPHKRRTPQRQK